MGTVRPIIPLLVLLSIVLLYCPPNSPVFSDRGNMSPPLGAPLIQEIPHADQPADMTKALKGTILLQLVAALGAWLAARTAFINYHRQKYTTHGIPTPRQFVLVCMHDQDGKKR